MRVVAIVDDCVEDAAQLARMVRSSSASCLPNGSGPSEWEISTFSSVDALSARMVEGYAPDLAFVDIVLDPGASPAAPAPTGVDAVERLFGAGSATQVVYVSGYDEFHTQVYRTRHAAYLAKPFSDKDVALALDLAQAARENASEQPFVVRAKGVERVVRPSDILYLESSLHSLRIHTPREAIETYGKLADVLSQLPRRFVRTHQSFAVNLDAVRSLEPAAVVLASGESVPVSRRMRASVREALFEHIRTERR